MTTEHSTTNLTTPNSAQEPHKTEAASCEKRRQILLSAGSVFMKYGYEGAAMADIARQASVSKGTLYNHFANKADLFTAFFEEMSRTKLDILEALSHNEQLELPIALMESAKTIIELMLDTTSIGLYCILLAKAECFPHLSNVFWRHGFARTLDNLSTWFTRNKERGLLHIDDTDLAAEQFLIMCQTRIVQRRRLRLPVDDSPENIARIARLTSESFLRIYGTIKNEDSEEKAKSE